MAAAARVSTTPPRGSRKARTRAVAPAVLAAEDAMDRAKHSTDPSDMAMSLRSPSASVRLAALKRLCPCKLRESAGRDEFEPVWDSIFALASDSDARIRAQVSSTNLVVKTAATATLAALFPLRRVGGWAGRQSFVWRGGRRNCRSEMTYASRCLETTPWPQPHRPPCLPHLPSYFFSPQTLHTICDGSPSCYEDRVKAALELFNRDADRKIRRQAHKVLASLIRTGKWNVL